MSGRIVRAFGLGVTMAVLAGCVGDAGAPVLLPVAAPVNPPAVAHGLCVADSGAMYDEAKQQNELRARLTGHADAAEDEEAARTAAHRRYLACVASEGYRPVYPG
ncbi:hypothetical protein [Rhizobium binxianense]